MTIAADPETEFRRALASIGETGHQDARSILEASLARHPNHPRLLLGLAFLERSQGRLGEATAWLEKAAAASPGDPAILNNLGLALLDAGRASEAIPRFRQALMLRPDHAETHGNLIFALDADPSGDAASQQRERKRWAERHVPALAAGISPHLNPREPDRRLRIGYVSADFCRHSAAAIFGPVVLGHDPRNFEIACYSSTHEPDEITDAFREKAALWRDIGGLADDRAADLIRADRIDILVDLSGHSGGGRLLVFARKPAPVQVSAWGHATGTGLGVIDVLFADGVVAPKHERRFYAETVEDLPCLLTFDPPADAPAIGDLASRKTGYLVFGSFNRIAKLSDQVLRRWAAIVGSLPPARLMLKDAGFDDSVLCDRVRGVLADAGLDAGLVDFLGRTDRMAHLAAYGVVDVALDPYPMNGGLSTLEALWMGVPVVTLRGRSISSRGGASILSALGFEDWIAESEADYAACAKRLAVDEAVRSRFRSRIRERMTATPLADTTKYVAEVEAIYRRLWRNYCASRP